MTNLNNGQKGFSFVGVLVVLVAVGLIVFAGLKVYDVQNASDNEATATTQSSEASSDSANVQEVAAENVPNKVETASDLAATEDLLDSVSVESDTSSLDADLATF